MIKSLVIGGAKDPSAPGMQSGYESILKNKGKATLILSAAYQL